jgi:hypothetical protein
VTAPALAVEQPDGSRLYVHPRTGEKVPSVTTIIKEGIAKPALMGWATRLAAEYTVKAWGELDSLPSEEKLDLIRHAHDRERDKASGLGTEVHSAIDAWCKGEPWPAKKETDSYLNNFMSFMMDFKPKFTENEVTVWSRTYQYAGTFDWLAEIAGDLYLGDTKTGRRVYPEVGLQLSALANADFILREDGREEPLPHAQYLAALHVRPRSWHFYQIGRDAENFRAFLACRELYSWIHETCDHVLKKVA